MATVKQHFIFCMAAVMLAAVPAMAEDSYPTYDLDAVEEGQSEVGEVHDPLEPMNRAIHGFNKVVDQALIAPTARVYRTVVPGVVRDRVSNVVRNIQEPVNMVNALIQGDVEHAFTSLWRFVLNTTLGVGGMFDFAGANAGLEYRKEDFGQTMGRYGVGPGPYLVLPILGPSNFRDALGLAVDILTNPFSYVDDEGVHIARAAATGLDARTAALDFTDDVDTNALDPYATYRSSYDQYRVRQVGEVRVSARYSGDPQCEE